MYHKKKHQIKLDKCFEQLIHEYKYKIGQYRNESIFSIIIRGINHLLYLTDIMVYYKLNICSNLMSARFFISIFFNGNFSALCLSYFSNSCNTSNFFILIFAMVICDQWSVMFSLWFAEVSDDG